VERRKDFAYHYPRSVLFVGSLKALQNITVKERVHIYTRVISALCKVASVFSFLFTAAEEFPFIADRKKKQKRKKKWKRRKRGKFLQWVVDVHGT
jgi:hypothetical protein